MKSFAETHHCALLRQAAEKFIQKHFVDVIQCEEFLQLEWNEVKDFIQDDNITVWCLAFVQVLIDTHTHTHTPHCTLIHWSVWPHHIVVWYIGAFGGLIKIGNTSTDLH